MKPHISATLLEALTNETCAKNIEILLYLTFTWLCEDIDYNSSEYLKQALTLVVRKVHLIIVLFALYHTHTHTLTLSLSLSLSLS